MLHSYWTPQAPLPHCRPSPMQPDRVQPHLPTLPLPCHTACAPRCACGSSQMCWPWASFFMPHAPCRCGACLLLPLTHHAPLLHTCSPSGAPTGHCGRCSDRRRPCALRPACRSPCRMKSGGPRLGFAPSSWCLWSRRCTTCTRCTCSICHFFLASYTHAAPHTGLAGPAMTHAGCCCGCAARQA
jgi:hypothetical protein